MNPEYSIVIVSKNRKQELSRTLQILDPQLVGTDTEILVFLDGCTDNSSELKMDFTKVRWFESDKSIGASAARHFLYPKANGKYLIGLDDDAHPLHSNFKEKVKEIFQQHVDTGIIAFQEIKGNFESDALALESVPSLDQEYNTNEFIGCGFAIRKEVYEVTNGFPIWIDIYGEEACLAIEVLAKGFDIRYSSSIKVNHRVNKEDRKKQGRNYFRFGKQLKNTTFHYLVYYSFPFYRIAKLYWHNLNKYALKDKEYFKVYCKVIGEVVKKAPSVLRHRNPIDKEVFRKMKELKKINF